MRKPFQGVWNIVRFNWPFYFLALAIAVIMSIISRFSNGNVSLAADIVLVLVGGLTLISLIASWYVYDLSGFYELDWLDDTVGEAPQRILNINAGFDETSGLLAAKFEAAELAAYDFFDPRRHTEPSIKRARKAYPPFPGTQNISNGPIPETDGSADRIFLILCAHEIRNADERDAFFLDLGRVLSEHGQVVVVEHTRDAANYFAYNLGAFHFHSRSEWMRTFEAAKLTVESERKITPFITVFFLNKNGIKS